MLAGSSYGGLAAATVAIRHPEVFGNVLSMSGSFWWSPPGTPRNRQEHVAGLIAAGPALPLRFFLSAGLFETGAQGTAGILETSRHLRDVLQAKGIPVTYRDYAGGHDYLVWQGVLADGLIALFGGDRP
ncbi:MAG TPA: alpha/beta hydrolase-fold protein [Shinella sp.]|nr:alpha/beta hydrolase-fold protein [Shinella sp.]